MANRTDRAGAPSERGSSPDGDAFGLLFRGHPLPFIIYDRQTLAVLDVNEAAIHNYGYTRDAFLELTIKDIRPPEDVPAMLAMLEQVKQTGKALMHVPGIWRHQRRDGSIIMVQITSHALIYEGRQADLVCAQDVTARTEAEAEAARFRFMVEHGGQEVYLVRPDGQLAYVNGIAAASVGYTVDELMAIGIPGIDPEYGRNYREHFEALKQHDLPPFETVHLTKDGRRVPKEVKSVFLRIGDEEYVCGFGQDISDRRDAEETLRLSEATYRNLINSVSESIYVQDENGCFLDVNRASEEMYGYPREAFIGRTPEFLSAPGKNDLGRVAEQVVRAFEGEPQQLEFWGLDSKGREFPKDVSLTPGEYFGRRCVIAVARDTTERKHNEAEKLEMERRLLHAQKLESLGVLAGGIAHDFNNLLTAILGNLELAMHDVPPDSEAHERVADAEHAVHRATTLTNQMLAYSGKGRFVIEPVDLSRLVEENAHMLRAVVPKSVDLEMGLMPALPAVNGDGGQLQQVVMNLIVNACEALEDKPGRVQIATGVADYTDAELAANVIDAPIPAGAYVYFEVSDDGCGMSPDICERLFEPFFSTKRTGRGLGMSAVLGIVRGHKGALFVQTREGEGTRIRVLIPPAPDASAVSTKEDESVAAAASDGGQRPGQAILVVDDEDYVRSVCRRMIEHHGHPVFTAVDGRDALSVFNEHREAIACVVLDLTMPRLDGVACARELHKLAPEVRIILSSGYSRDDVSRRLGDAQVAGFVQKPYKAADLLAELDRVLNAAE